MTILQALFLGVLQGLTEFLPISSSGHLVIAESLLNLHIPIADLQGFDVLLHAGSALALFICYYELWMRLLRSLTHKHKGDRKIITLLVYATIPAAVLGVLFQDVIAENFRSTTSVAIAFLITAIVLILGERMKGKKSYDQLAPWECVTLGCAQALALIPGLSRAGLTASAGRFVGLNRRQALDFSFLMAFPIIVGATVITFKDIANGSVQLPSVGVSLIGIIASFVSSYIAIQSLRVMVTKHSLAYFALYLAPIGLVLLTAL